MVVAVVVVDVVVVEETNCGRTNIWVTLRSRTEHRNAFCTPPVVLTSSQNIGNLAASFKELLRRKTTQHASGFAGVSMHLPLPKTGRHVPGLSRRPLQGLGL